MTKPFLAALILAACAFAKPDFSGSWKMDATKSDFGFIPAPTSFERKIQHSEPELGFVTRQAGQRGETTTEVKLTTDGKLAAFQLNGQDVKAKAKWEGDVLVVESKRTTLQGEMTLTERWTLAPDRKSILIDAKGVTPSGEFPLKIYLDKQ